ncbi:MAG TPA: glyoxalase superfamily protein [Steroidobacteraceae bacterium]|nr:glyoxalase superfamily protein [Steroidobacteraceae bacterium]
MRNFRDAKAMAQTLRAALAAMGFKITVSQSLELIAQAFGAADWNTLSAAIRAPTTPAPEDAPKPTSPKPLSAELESTLTQVFAYAKARKHEEVTVEHLALLLLDDAETARVMQALSINIAELRRKLADYIDNNVGLQPDGADPKPSPTLGFQRVLQRAVFHVQQSGNPPVKTLNVLVALFSEKNSHAVQLVRDQGVIRIDVVNYITHGLVKGGGGPVEGPTPA